MSGRKYKCLCYLCNLPILQLLFFSGRRLEAVVVVDIEIGVLWNVML